MLLMPDEDLDESGKYRLGARRISSDPFLLDYPGFHRGEPLTLCRRARIWSHLPDDLKSAFGRTFDSRGSLHAEADRLGVAGWILRLNAYRERLLDGTLLADDPLANEIYPKTSRKILPPARPACVVCGRPHDETDGRDGVCSACISIAERVLARTTVRAAGTPAPSAPKSEPKASGPETAASEDKPSDTAYERTCVDCGSLFRITKGEAEHLRNLGYRLPARCKACRAERRAKKKGDRTQVRRGRHHPRRNPQRGSRPHQAARLREGGRPAAPLQAAILSGTISFTTRSFGAMQFLEYMLRSGRLQPVSCRKYAGALYGTLSRMAEMPLSEIESAHEFEQIAEGLRQLDAFSQLNKTSNHMYSSALKWKRELQAASS